MDKQIIAAVLVALTSGFTITGYAQEVDREILLRHCQAPMFLQLSDQTYLLRVNTIENKEQGDEKPPLNPVRIAGEVLGGTLAGIGGGVVAVRALLPIAEDSRFKQAILVTGLSTSYALGSGSTVYLIGNIGNQTGSFPATMLGVLAGGVVGAIGAIIIAAVTGNDDNDHEDLAELFLFLSPAIGGTIAFNLTRKYESSNNLHNQTSNAAPPIRLDLLRVRF